jgi:bifunctional UDP-N-acetylglucosamine pyrophosphorylase/glucosamine-1-phosphate N-acetyltransferase
MRIAAVILAAGQGTRMRSTLPKVLHRVAGLPMVRWSVDNARSLGAAPVALVVGEGADAVRDTVGPDAEYALQTERLGTGHALLQAREVVSGRADSVLVLYGDMPTLRRETMQALLALHAERRSAITMLTVRSEDSMGFGRIVRDGNGRVSAIVEEAVATPEILAIRELNCGVYCFDAEWLWRRLPDVPLTPPKNEYYLTDMVSLAAADGRAIEAVTVDDIDEVQGVNTRVHLAHSERILRGRINERLMLGGVTLIDPATTYVDATVEVGGDTVIYPNTTLRGYTTIGEGCEIGPNSVIVDAHIADGCRVIASVVEEAAMDEGAEIGPYGHLRKGAHLGAGVHMGNFGEVKNAYLASGTKMGHFSYVGDAEIGENTNIGAGTITCNYDGQHKHRTTVGADAFIGSGTMLVAPLNVGEGAKIGAGSVVTHDVPDHTLAYGVPARTKRSLNDEDEETHDKDV